MNKKFYMFLCGIVIVVYSIFYVSTTTFAASTKERGRPQPPSAKEMSNQMMNDLKSRLTLTADQEKQLQSALQSYFEKRNELFEKSRPEGQMNQPSGDRPEPPSGDRPEPPSDANGNAPGNGNAPAEPKELTELRQSFEKEVAAFLSDAQIKELQTYFEEQQQKMRPGGPVPKPSQQE